ncbi:thiamine phosphate synthase [Acinetobacter gerneri]|uniref:Thiamine-phosphate synthase n=2 Tax=Acinetobacter gerneri TaxID=202952 RepID=N8ZJX9_9GAMM|nr:thiamine phosphate synthase [Acinetobacter gerneri]ENV34039.1 thiamine-phosphate pyrophosphorylase [Acinetobacter gerneri DSM 14967 = CIP 107464 = MTCC 9824]EPR84139.1 Thiamin-phosphate pyrophosphorylase [Acinetobacter gerneri DSM 14967 = CIP 107464 = MTCC 9824]MDQ9010002.1 thiamine phosphate synthase [Acinetobacter gerneri]MDQ9014076.1 thiamine phosphate synthase [Acinetobacter gerneri]MDQ9025356.1 thiamine phosphate synthase [Acinetobacter gerneri]
MRGLYLITNDDALPLLLEKLEVALATQKIAILQYRRKKVAKIDQANEVKLIKQLCEKYQTPFVINDDLDLAEQFGLGVHLGQSDGEIVDAKARLPQGVIIGRTCLNSLELAEKAIADGASYVAFGAIYATSTKPEAGNIGLDAIKNAAEKFDLPICAIGGLTVENSKIVIESGADLCAVISDILGKSVQDIPERVQAWAQLF